LEESRFLVALSDVVDWQEWKRSNLSGLDKRNGRTEYTDVERVKSSLQSSVVGGRRGEVDSMDLSLDRGVLCGCTETVSTARAGDKELRTDLLSNLLELRRSTTGEEDVEPGASKLKSKVATNASGSTSDDCVKRGQQASKASKSGQKSAYQPRRPSSHRTWKAEGGRGQFGNSTNLRKERTGIPGRGRSMSILVKLQT
jgi:hypothetical protein